MISKAPAMYVPCCDASLPIIKISSYLLNKLWPELEVHFLGFSQPGFDFYNTNHYFHSMAPTQEGGASMWTRYIHNFLKDIDDEFVIFSIDDYWLCTEPNLDMIDLALNLMIKNSDIGRFDLTFDSQVEGNLIPLAQIGDYKIAQKHPQAEYRISTQPALWKKDFLLRFLDHNWTPWDFEVKGSQIAGKDNMPEQTLGFYDKKMSKYPIRTTAKGAVSRFNPGKYNVLGIPIETIKELVNEGFFTEDELIWGQHSDNPPGFFEKEGYDFHPGFLDYHPTSKTGFLEYHSIYDDPEHPMLTVNLFDKNFIHTQNHPDFGFISSQGERTVRSKKIRYLPFQKSFNMFSGITLFTEHFLNKDLIKSIESPIKIGWIIETPTVHPWAYQNLLNVIDDLDYVFSYSKELSEKYDNCYLFNNTHPRIHKKDWGIHNKKKLLSFICSDKKITEYHKFRHKIAEKYSKKYNIDLWGKGYNPFNDGEKGKGLNDYMFTIVVPNCKFDTFIGEIIDAFLAGCVPIYSGTKEIEKYFDVNGIIMFDTIDDLNHILNNVNENTYESMLPAIKKNFITAQKYWRSEDQLAELIYEVVELDCENKN